MAVEVSNLLPIGSVIALEGAEKRLMIFGVKQIDASTNIEYDYVGVVYPEGNMGQDMQFLFNHEDIAAVFFLGYEDVERQFFINELEKAVQGTYDTDMEEADVDITDTSSSVQQ